MFPMALVCGNTYVIKPSEQDPGACMELVGLAQQAGVPDGVVNVIHGTKDGMLKLTYCLYHQCLFAIIAVDFVCDDPSIRAISFVGSDRVGKYIYERGTANGKRVQSNMVCLHVAIIETVTVLLCRELRIMVL